MPRARVLPYGSVERHYSISEAGLDAAQKNLGLKLNAETRRLIRLATVALSFGVQVEAAAPSRANIAKIKEFQKLVHSLQKIFPYRRHEQFRRSKERSEFVSRHHQGNWRSVASAFWLQWFAEVLNESADIANVVLQQLSRRPDLRKAPGRGDAWDLWVFVLNKICKNAQLPAGVRKDNLGISTFVALVNEIQKQLPSQLRCLLKKRQPDTLAIAIRRAISGLSVLNDLPVEILIDEILGVASYRVEDGKVLVSSPPEEIERERERLLQTSQDN